MRSKDILLNGFEKIKILLQYLYMSEEHSITVNNGMTDLKIFMDDKGNFKSQNMSFSDIPPMSIELGVQNLLGCIEQLKEQKPTLDYGDFGTRWNEIEKICKANTALNEFTFN